MWTDIMLRSSMLCAAERITSQQTFHTVRGGIWRTLPEKKQMREACQEASYVVISVSLNYNRQKITQGLIQCILICP